MKNTLILWVSLITLVFSNLTLADNQVICLAKNIYYEAGAESFDGKLAVAQVTINRTKYDGYPNTVCGVVKQKRNGTCQFSWFCQEPKPINKKSKNWQDSLHVANLFLTYKMSYDKLSEDVIFFHTVSSPFTWVKRYQKHTIVGNHIFYKPKKKINT
jgi:N-acetylmuramoyl-L-alanine amidase